MCLGVPGRVQSTYTHDGVRMGKVNFGGGVKDICLAYVPELEVGDYTIVHVGFALTRIDEASARQTLQLFSELGILDDELNPQTHEDSAQAPACPVDPWDRRRAGQGPR
jgi:hydrogenase expression/formation protein HypC